MYNGIGLTTPRGSGTSGYVTRNLSHVKHRKTEIEYRKEREQNEMNWKLNNGQGEPNKDILDHERKRKIELKVITWAENSGIYDNDDYTEAEKEAIIAKKREEMFKAADTLKLDTHQSKKQSTHERRYQQQQRTEKFRNALKIDKDYVEGSAHNPEVQAALRREREKARLMREHERKKEAYERGKAERRREREYRRNRDRDRRSRSRERYRGRRRSGSRDRDYRRRRRSGSRDRDYRRGRSEDRRSEDKDNDSKKQRSHSRSRSVSPDRKRRESRSRSKSPRKRTRSPSSSSSSEEGEA